MLFRSTTGIPGELRHNPRDKKFSVVRRFYGSGPTDTGSRYGLVSLIHALDLPIPPSPTTPSPSVSLLHAPPQLTEYPVSGSRLHHLPAGSPDLVSRIEFVILRMDRAPPAASHPVLRRRSCIRFHAGERMHEEDFHLSDRVRSQAHWHGRPAREARQDKIQHRHGRDGHATKTRLARDCVRVMRPLAISVWQGSGQAISRDTGGS